MKTSTYNQRESIVKKSMLRAEKKKKTVRALIDRALEEYSASELIDLVIEVAKVNGP